MNCYKRSHSFVMSKSLFINLISDLSSQVVKENQILHKGDRIIDSDNEYATLADVNIFAGDQIIVRDSEIHENRDIAGKLFDSGNVVRYSIMLLQ